MIAVGGTLGWDNHPARRGVCTMLSMRAPRADRMMCRAGRDRAQLQVVPTAVGGLAEPHKQEGGARTTLQVPWE